MAKKKSSKKSPHQALQDADLKHYIETEKYVQKVQQLYDKAIADLSALALKVEGIPEDKPFEWKHNPAVAKDVEATIQTLADRIAAVVETGSRKEWTAACVKSEQFVASIMKVSKLTQKTLQSYQDRNLAALASFTEREVEGLNLSKRVWKHVAPLAEEVELVVDTSQKYYKHGINSGKTMTKMERAIGTGMSAQELSREIRTCLVEPNKLFRRVRDKYGNLHLSKAAKLYHPGQGVYRSSYKNAMRLTRSEINMAYRQSDHLRWQQLDFVTGMKIQLSNNHTCLGVDGKPHPFYDICDVLAGDYPKDFKFVGWHPQCRCYATPILRPYDEMMEEREHIDEKGYKQMPATNEVKDPPKAFNDYITENAERMAGWKSTPYYIKDNPHWIDKALHPEKYVVKSLVLTQEQQKALEDLRMYAFNHQGSKKFAAALDEALQAQLAGDRDAFYAAMEQMMAIRKKNEDSRIMKAQQRKEAKLKPIEQRKAFDARIAAIREKAQLYPNSRISLDEIDTAYITMNLTKLEAAVAAQEDIIRRHEAILDLQRVRRLRRTDKDVQDLLEARQAEKDRYEKIRKYAEDVAKKAAAHPWADASLINPLRSDLYALHLDRLEAYARSVEHRLAEFEKKMVAWEAIVPDIRAIASQYTYSEFEQSVEAIKKRLATIKRQKLQNQEKTLEQEVKNAANAIFKSAYEARLKVVRIDVKIAQMQPDIDAFVTLSAGTSVKSFAVMANEAKAMLAARDVTAAENLLTQLQAMKPHVEKYQTLLAFNSQDKRFLAPMKQALDELENGNISGAVAALNDAEVMKNKIEAERAAKAAKRAAAKNAPAQPTPAPTPAKTIEDATSYAELKQILGSEMPKMLEHYEESIARDQWTRSEYKREHKQIEENLKDLFDGHWFGHTNESYLFDERILDGGVFTNLQKNRIVYHMTDDDSYDRGRRSYGHFAYYVKRFKNKNATVPRADRLGDGEYYRCGTPVPKDYTKAYENRARGYGDTMVIMRKDKVVTTFTYGNSLGTDCIPSLTCDPKVCSVDNKRMTGYDQKGLTLKRTQMDVGYVEIQYLPKNGTDRLMPSDMEAIVFPKDPMAIIPRKEVWDRWYEAGVDIYYMKSGKAVLWRKGKPRKTVDEARQHAEEILARRASLTTADIKAGDWKKIQDYIKAGDFYAADDLAMQIENTAKDVANRRAALTKYIPDVEQQNQRFTIQELEEAYKAIETQMSWYSRRYANDEDFIAKLARDAARTEADKKYSTWEIMRDAQLRKRDEVIYAVRRKSIDDNIKRLEAFGKKTSDKAFLEAMAKLTGKAKEGKWSEVEDLIKTAKKAMTSIRRSSNAALKLGESMDVFFDSSDFTQARKDAAKWFRGMGQPPTAAQMRKAFKQADDYMIQYAMEIWPKLTEEERLVLWLYTDGSRYVNEEMLGTYALKLIDPKGKVHNGLHDANILTSIIEKAPELRDDVWMQSGKSIGAFDAIFGTNLRGTSMSDLSKLVGREGRSNIFMSCHSARDGAFTKDTNTGTRNDVVLTIFMPKGTKGMYCEPFASYGDADRRRRGIQWDGKSREAPGDQVEFLLQRGSKFRITKAEWDPIQRKWFIDVDLIEQEGQMALDELIPNLNRRTERQARS